MSSIVPIAFEMYAESVLKFGAKKYGLDTWRFGKHFNAADNHLSIIRHTLKADQLSDEAINDIIQLIKYKRNTSTVDRGLLDDESGLPHLSCSGTRSFMGNFIHEYGFLTEDSEIKAL